MSGVECCSAWNVPADWEHCHKQVWKMWLDDAFNRAGDNILNSLALYQSNKVIEILKHKISKKLPLCYRNIFTIFRCVSHYKILSVTEIVVGALAKLRKMTISFVMSVLMEEFRSYYPISRSFIKFDMWGFFENLSSKFGFELNPTVPRWFLLRMRNISNKL